MRTAFLHLIGGASGDMLLGALVDAGLPLSALEEDLSTLSLKGLRLQAHPARRGGVHGTRIVVTVGEEGPWGWEGFRRRVQGASLPPDVQERSLAVLSRLEEAERRAHRGEVGPLAELGSPDTLVDVVGVVAGLHRLGVRRLFSSPLPLGSGVVPSGHGPLPVPAPATLELVAMAGAPVVPPGGESVGERVTPTGAALITTLASFHRPLLRVERVGYGAGERDTPSLPNILALWLGQEVEGERGDLVLLETNIDDAPPHLLGYVQERLRELGALDVWAVPIQMKKDRPGVLLSVLLPAVREGEAVSLLFRETPTLGVRTRQVRRYEAPREVVEVETSLGRVPVKVKWWQGEVAGLSPEYEACRRIARERGLPLQEVLRRVGEEARRSLPGRALFP